MDLTTIEKPFGLLDDETQKALEAAKLSGEAVESFWASGWSRVHQHAEFYGGYTYRVRPTPKPPAIELPWDVIDPRWKWAAIDKDGDICLHQAMPPIHDDYWARDETWDITGLFSGIRINVTDWKQSLTKRPE